MTFFSLPSFARQWNFSFFLALLSSMQNMTVVENLGERKGRKRNASKIRSWGAEGGGGDEGLKNFVFQPRKGKEGEGGIDALPHECHVREEKRLLLLFLLLRFHTGK